MHKIAVVGTIFKEYCGMPLHAIAPGASVEGHFFEMIGGVGRNIACNLKKLGEDVYFVTAVGDDEDSFSIMDDCESYGVNTDYAVSVSGEKLPKRMRLTTTGGDTELAVHDGKSFFALKQEFFLAHCMDLLDEVDAVVLDGDLPAKALEFLTSVCTCPIYCDPASTENTGKLRPLLSRIHLIKPDLQESLSLAASKDLPVAAERLNQFGVEKVFISQAANGMFARDLEGNSIHVPCKPAYLETALGVGDAMTAALVWADLMGMNMEKSAECAMRAASLTASSRNNIHPDLSPEKLLS